MHATADCRYLNGNRDRQKGKYHNNKNYNKNKFRSRSSDRGYNRRDASPYRRSRGNSPYPNSRRTSQESRYHFQRSRSREHGGNREHAMYTEVKKPEISNFKEKQEEHKKEADNDDKLFNLYDYHTVLLTKLDYNLIDTDLEGDHRGQRCKRGHFQSSERTPGT